MLVVSTHFLAVNTARKRTKPKKGKKKLGGERTEKPLNLEGSLHIKMGGIMSSNCNAPLATKAVSLGGISVQAAQIACASQTVASNQASSFQKKASQAALEAQAQAADGQQQAQAQLADAKAQASQAALEAQAQAADGQQQAQAQLADAQAQASQAALEAQAQAADGQQQAQAQDLAVGHDASDTVSSTQFLVPRLKVQLQQALDTDAQLESSLPSSRVKDALLTHLTAAAVLETTAVEASKVDEISAAISAAEDAGLKNNDTIADNDASIPPELSPRVVEAYECFIAQITSSSLPDTLDHIDFQALDLSGLDIKSVGEIQEFHANVLSEHIEHTTLLELCESDVESILFGLEKEDKN